MKSVTRYLEAAIERFNRGKHDRFLQAALAVAMAAARAREVKDPVALAIVIDDAYSAQNRKGGAR